MAAKVPDQFCRELPARGQKRRQARSFEARSRDRAERLRKDPGQASDFRWRPLRALRLLEEALCRLGSRCRILPPRLLRTSPLSLSRILTSPGFLLRSGRPLNTVAWRQTNFEFDDFVPYGVGALVVRNRQQFPQAAARVRELRFIACGLGRRPFVTDVLGRGGLLARRGFEGRLFARLFFIHGHIIARIVLFDPVLHL